MLFIGSKIQPVSLFWVAYIPVIHRREDGWDVSWVINCVALLLANEVITANPCVISRLPRSAIRVDSADCFGPGTPLLPLVPLARESIELYRLVSAFKVVAADNAAVATGEPSQPFRRRSFCFRFHIEAQPQSRHTKTILPSYLLVLCPTARQKLRCSRKRKQEPLLTQRLGPSGGGASNVCTRHKFVSA